MEHTYAVTGMTCAGCQYKVQTLLGKVSGVTDVDIDLDAGEAHVKMDHHVPTSDLQNALKEYPKYQLNEKQVSMPAMSAFEELAEKSWVETYKPILLIFGYIFVASMIAGATPIGFNEMLAMRIFMAGFFLVFSFFKLLNLEGFADSYAMYDVIARKFKGWGYIYAFTELALGLAYATNFQPVITNAVTFVVMSVSIVGVLQTVLSKKTIRCACLGAVFNLPMSTVTIIEDGLMIAMSAVMLVMLF
ncbi:heavy-metal-associated domain-containing protein [Mucilaginibacter sp. KACC 22063]|uniref:heavy-metal-associated domain-containing protein n=1 Tax=Mucilaginibacter sp. KACC 22063 TaxID=3025666 RepID=UPI002366CF36|nr:cation transporter [Mucilaginibacter sp. KACC 22063]WDF54055.1 cation transporter [Mucilaginibacter sp. KACC 22063]